MPEFSSISGSEPVPMPDVLLSSRPKPTNLPGGEARPGQRGLRLLSLDGGGVRGLSELLILEQLMRRLQRKQNLSTPPLPCEIFDMICGTSTGGKVLIAIMLGRLRMSISKCQDSYGEFAENVFGNPKRFMGEGAFKATNLKKAIMKIVQECKLGSKMIEFRNDSCKVFVCAVSTADVQSPRLFRTYEHDNIKDDIEIWAAARATSAAPGFFKRAEISTRPGVVETFHDGAVGWNNPALELCEEARNVFPGRNIDCVISIGTGTLPGTELPPPRWWYGKIPLHVIPTLKTIATDCDKPHVQMSRNFKDKPNTYFRFNVSGMKDVGLEEWKLLGDIRGKTIAYLQDPGVDENVNAAVKTLHLSITRSEQESSSIASPIKDQLPTRNRPGAPISRTGSSSLGRQLASSVQQKFPSVTDKGSGHMTTESEWDQNRTAKVRAPEDPQRTEAARTDTEQQQAFLRGLKIDPGAMHTVKAEKETRFGNTCEWILTRDAYRNWNTGTGSQVLVIAAPPGQGKSVLAKYLLETFSKIPEKHVVLDYFCQGSPGRNTALSVAQSLLYQLLTTRPQLFKYVPQQHTRSTDRAPELPFDTMWKILADLLKSAETGDVYCVIDGIDECERESQEILCNAIEKSFTPQSNSEAPSGNYIRFLLTSRPTTPATRLGHLSNLYEIQNSDVDPDITEYIKFHVQKMTRARMLPIQLSYIVTSLLSSQAEGMFLLVSLNLTELDQSRGNLSFYALLQKLEEIPKNVQEVYAEAIKQIQQNPGYRDLAKTILDVLLVCHDPLTVDSFGIACYDWPQSCTSHSELENSVVMNFEYPSKTACSSLIRFVEGTIQFCHPTARQYLLTPQSNLGSFSFDLAECHLYMARLCLRYLLLDDLRITKSEQEASGVEDPGKAFPLLEYALRNWSHHLRQSKHILERYPELLKSFFDPQSERFRHILSPWAYFQNFPKVYGSGDVLVLHALVFFELTDMILHTKLLNPESTQRQAFCQTEFFLELKTGVDGRNADSDTPLILATGRSSLAVVRTLLQLGADPDAVNEDGNTALHLAAGSSGLKDDLDILKLLMSVTKFPEARNKKGYPPFLLVADEQVAEALLDCGVDVDCERDGDKTTLLEIAGEEGRVELAKLLILRGADVNHLDSTHWNPLCAAVRGGNTEIVKLLIGKKARVFSDSEYGWSPLHAAAAAGSSEAIRALLDYGVDVNIQTLNKRTALYVATFDGQLEAVETLLQAKANVMLPDEDGNTPLHVAAENGKELIVQELINANADVNSVSGDFSTPLTYACKGNHLSTVQLLLNKGANVNFTHPSTIPMLQLAIFSGYTDVANLLIASGINIESTYKSKFTPLYVAAWKNQPEIAKVLLLRGAAHQCFGDSNKSALHHFAEHGHVDLVEQLLEDVDQNIQTDEGWTPLHYAADSGHLAVVRQILRAKADLRARTSHGFTALILSCMKGRFDVVEYLLGKGANPNDFSHNGLSSVAAAALNGHLEILNLLLERGASASAKSENGLTALFTAAQGGHLEVVNRLLDLGVEIDALYGPGLWPPLFVAAQEGHFAIVEKLLDSQSNPSYVAKSGTTLLHLVVGKGGAQVTKRLVREGADITGLNRANSQPLLIACLDGDPGVVDTLIKHGANVNHANRFGQTAMHAAASKGHLPIVDRLLKAQADPNFRDFEGWAPIMFASCRGHAQIVERLLETNIDPNMESNLFTTPLHLATYHHWESTIKVLLKAGADPCILDSYGQSSLEWAHLHGDTFEIMKDWHKHYEETSEQIKRDRLQSSVALVSQRALTRQSEPRSDTYYLFNDLGIFLYRLGNFADAYVGFEQSIVDRDSHLHGMSCSWCDVEEVKGKRFTCKTCAETSLCNPCMDKYREEDTGFRGCRGHDFLEIPRPEWDSFPPEAVNEKDETLGKWLERIAEKYKFAASEHQQSASSGADLLESPRADACPSTTVTSLAPIMEVDLHSAVEIHTESRTEAEAGSSVNARMVQEPTLSDPTKEVTPSARSEDTRLAKAEGKPSFTAVDTSASIVTQQHALPADEQAYPVNEGGPAPSTDDARKASADGGLVADSDHRDCMDAGAAVIPPTNGHAESDQGETAKFDTVLGS